jgi:hypothetical protein
MKEKELDLFDSLMDKAERACDDGRVHVTSSPPCPLSIESTSPSRSEPCSRGTGPLRSAHEGHQVIISFNFITMRSEIERCWPLRWCSVFNRLRMLKESNNRQPWDHHTPYNLI